MNIGRRSPKEAHSASFGGHQAEKKSKSLVVVRSLFGGGGGGGVVQCSICILKRLKRWKTDNVLLTERSGQVKEDLNLHHRQPLERKDTDDTGGRDVSFQILIKINPSNFTTLPPQSRRKKTTEKTKPRPVL